MSRRTTTAKGYGTGWQKLRLQILRRDGGVCHWCGGPARSVDHVTPKVEGGSDDPSNLVAACTACNSRRSLAMLRERRRVFGDRIALPTAALQRDHRRDRAATGVLASSPGDCA